MEQKTPEEDQQIDLDPDCEPKSYRDNFFLKTTTVEGLLSTKQKVIIYLENNIQDEVLPLTTLDETN